MKHMEKMTRAFGVAALAGTIALSAAGCTAEIKSADGTPIGSVVVNGDEALASGFVFNTTTGDQEENPSQESVPVMAEAETDPSETVPAEPPIGITVESEPEGKEEPSGTAAKASEPSGTAAKATEPSEATHVSLLASVRNGTVYKFTKMKTGDLGFSNGYESIFIEPYKAGTVKISYKEKTFLLDWNGGSTAFDQAYIFKENGDVYFYLTIDDSDENAVNRGFEIYTVKEDTIGHFCFMRDINIEEFRSTGYIRCSICNSVSDQLEIVTPCKIKNGTPKAIDNTEYILSGGAMKAVKDLNGNIVKDGKATSEKASVKAGEDVTPICVTGGYLDVWDAGMNRIRIDISSVLEDFSEIDDPQWMYRALASLVTKK